jgi:hypothetical protein
MAGVRLDCPGVDAMVADTAGSAVLVAVHPETAITTTAKATAARLPNLNRI